MRRLVFFAALFTLVSRSSPVVLGFCGLYCAKADTRLYNRASQVVLVRDGDRTVMTMASDFKGDLKEFAVVIPVPTFLQREQIHVGDQALVDHLDAYSAPRLVEYFDGNPCLRSEAFAMRAASGAGMAAASPGPARSLGVTIEAHYTVGEYDIVILSARQSEGLETWLGENGYRIPRGASPVLSSYLKQNMRFFVARVNLSEQARLGFSYLRPLQVAYESPKFILPIRLGMVNADGQQELYVYALTRRGRVDATNYRTVRVPSDVDLPLYLKAPDEFGKFYRAMFARQVQLQGGSTLFLEYAWDMSSCDPCAASPLSRDELRQLGAFWVESADVPRGPSVPRFLPQATRPPDVFLTRLHVRYDNAHFPEDLVFQETADRGNFQGRYVLRHPWAGAESGQGPGPETAPACPQAALYRDSLSGRHELEARRLASLTGWDLEAIRRNMGLGATREPKPKPLLGGWWEQLWRK
jgi:hypothetical protein